MKHSRLAQDLLSPQATPCSPIAHLFIELLLCLEELPTQWRSQTDAERGHSTLLLAPRRMATRSPRLAGVLHTQQGPRAAQTPACPALSQARSSSEPSETLKGNIGRKRGARRGEPIGGGEGNSLVDPSSARASQRFGKERFGEGGFRDLRALSPPGLGEVRRKEEPGLLRPRWGGGLPHGLRAFPAPTYPHARSSATVATVRSSTGTRQQGAGGPRRRWPSYAPCARSRRRLRSQRLMARAVAPTNKATARKGLTQRGYKPLARPEIKSNARTAPGSVGGGGAAGRDSGCRTRNPPTLVRHVRADWPGVW